ncbi:MAG: cytochrome c oxidase subunit 4 [Actinomycetota bacterium]
MKFGWQLFAGIALFYGVTTVVYGLWAEEVVGIVALILSTCLAALIAFYFWFTNRRLGATLPEDNLEGEIADRAGEQGFFSPHSWWPLTVALFATITALGLILGWWMTLIGAAALMISIMGWSMQYERN